MGMWKRRKRALPWKEPLDVKVINWFLNRSFWKSVAVNVVSAAIIAMGATFVLSIAIYKKVDYKVQQDRITSDYWWLFLFVAMTIVFAMLARRRSRKDRDKGAVALTVSILTAPVAVYYLLSIWSMQITNLVNTIEITEFSDGTHISHVFTYLSYDEFGYPRYMDDVPYSAR